jgi:hypothetical protein
MRVCSSRLTASQGEERDCGEAATHSDLLCSQAQEAILAPRGAPGSRRQTLARISPSCACARAARRLYCAASCPTCTTSILPPTETPPRSRRSRLTPRRRLCQPCRSRRRHSRLDPRPPPGMQPQQQLLQSASRHRARPCSSSSASSASSTSSTNSRNPSCRRGSLYPTSTVLPLPRR